MTHSTNLYGALTRVLAVRGAQFSDVFEIPLVLGGIVRRLMVEKFADINDQDTLRKFNQTLEITDAAATKAACRFLDVFHDQLNTRIKNHNSDLARAGKENGLDLSSFEIAAVD